MDKSHWKTAIYSSIVGLILGAFGDQSFERYVMNPKREKIDKLNRESSGNLRASLEERSTEYKSIFDELRNEYQKSLDELRNEYQKNYQKNLDELRNEYQKNHALYKEQNEELLKINKDLLSINDKLKRERQLLIDAIEGRTERLMEELEKESKKAIPKSDPKKF